MPGIVQRLRYLLTGKPPASSASPLNHRVKVDAAESNDGNRKHWGGADQLGPNSAFDHTTRVRLRSRGRYETLNNAYCRSTVRSLAYDLIGTGPRLQLTIPDDKDGAGAKTVERNHARWARAARLAMKYRIMEKASARCGGCFGILDTNPRITNPVKLDVRLVEIDQCAAAISVTDPKVIDGILIDDFGNPVEYYFLKYHPGEISLAGVALPSDFITVPASQVLHWREVDRPGQLHGIPKITSALPLFSQLRRIRLATLTAMEFASVIAGIMKTNLPPEAGVQTPGDWSLFELVRGALLTLPEGWEASQFKSEHPNATFEMMNREILNESGRSVGAPLNVVTGNSSGYNFSSGRLDHLPYHRGITIDRDDFRTIVLDPVFVAWEEEARMVGQVPANLPPIEEWTWEWLWDPFDSIDQVKDATADDIRLKNGTTTYAEVVGDADAHFDKLAREKAAAESRGLPWPILSTTPAASAAPAPPNSMEQAIAMALDDVGVEEGMAAEILSNLAPTFAELRTRRNGYRHNGHPVAGGAN